MSSLLVGVPPLHRIALLTARQKLGLPLDDRDRDTQARLAALALRGMLPLR